MKDTYILAKMYGIDYHLIATQTSVASPITAINAFGIIVTEKDYKYKSKAFHEAGRLISSHLEQHAQSHNQDTANHARESLQKLALLLI